MDENEHEDEHEDNSSWNLTEWLIVFPLAGLATYVVRTRWGWGDAGWEDLVAYIGFWVVLSLIAEAVRDLLGRRRSEEE